MNPVQIQPRVIKMNGRRRVLRRLRSGSLATAIVRLGRRSGPTIRIGSSGERAASPAPALRQDLPAVDVVEFHEVLLPAILAGERGALASQAARGLGPLVLEVGGRSWTYRCGDDGIVVHDGAAEDAWVAVSMGALTWSDVAASLRSIMSLHLANGLRITSGSIYELGQWEVALRALYTGLPAYDPSRVALVEIDGTPMDLTRRFTLDDDDEELRHWLVTAGFLHLTGVLSADEVAALLHEAQRLSDTTEDDDPTVWWATQPDGTKVLCRIAYAHTRSPLVERLATDPRLQRLARLAGESVVHFLDRLEGPHLIFKPPGELAGLSNLPWHLDSWYDAPSITSPSVTLGIQVTGSSSSTGRMEVVAGSCGQSFSPALLPEEMAGWPVVGLDTEPGDVTVHLTDVFHASPPPTGQGGRATLYMRCYPASAADFVGPGEMVHAMLERRNQRAAADAAARG